MNSMQWNFIIVGFLLMKILFSYLIHISDYIILKWDEIGIIYIIFKYYLMNNIKINIVIEITELNNVYFNFLKLFLIFSDYIYYQIFNIILAAKI